MLEKKFDVSEELRELLSYDNLKRGCGIEETIDSILEELEERTEPWERFKEKNLQKHLIEWRCAKWEKEEFGEISVNIKRFIENIIIKKGLGLKDIKTSNLKINEQYIDTDLRLKFDIIGDKHIFYIYTKTCRGDTTSRILTSWQYFYEKSRKKYDYIVIAPQFGEGYHLAFGALETLALLGVAFNIINIKYTMNKNGLNFEKYDMNNQEIYEIRGGSRKYYICDLGIK